MCEWHLSAGNIVFRSNPLPDFPALKVPSEVIPLHIRVSADKKKSAIAENRGFPGTLVGDLG